MTIFKKVKIHRFLMVHECFFLDYLTFLMFFKKILFLDILIHFFLFFAVRPSLEPGWLEGNLDGRRGLVPENYVEFIN